MATDEAGLVVGPTRQYCWLAGSVFVPVLHAYPTAMRGYGYGCDFPAYGAHLSLQPQLSATPFHALWTASPESPQQRFPGPTAGSPLGRVARGTALLLPLQGLLPLSISAPFIISGGVGQRRQESSFPQRPFNTTTASPREDKFSRPREIDIITPSKSLPLRIRGTWFVTVLTVTVLGSTTMFPGR